MFIFAIFARTTKNGSRSLRFNPLKIATICRQSAFVFSAWFSAQRVISSLCGTILLIFITEAECIYCAVRTEFLNIPQVHLRLSMVNSVTYVNFLCLRIRLWSHGGNTSGKRHSFHTSALDGGGHLYTLGKHPSVQTVRMLSAQTRSRTRWRTERFPSAFSTVFSNVSHKISFTSHTQSCSWFDVVKHYSRALCSEKLY